MRLFTLLIIALCIPVVGVAGSADSLKDCLMISHAQVMAEKLPRAKSAADYMRLANSGHQIVVGTSTVIALRVFDDQNSGVDSQVFSKLTIEATSASASKDPPGPIRVVHSYYTSGGVGFIQRGEYWVAHDFSPQVEFTYDGPQQVATISARFAATEASTGAKKNVALHYSCSVRKVAIRDLNEWEGKPSTGFRSFAPPAAK